MSHQGGPLGFALRLWASGAAGSLGADRAHHPCITGSSLRARQKFCFITVKSCILSIWGKS